MERHGFETLGDFRGRSLPYLTTHAELVRLQAARKAADREVEAARGVRSDTDWTGDEFVRQSDALSRG
jgi:hypothetical protein